MKKMRQKVRRRIAVRSGNPGKGRQIKVYSCKRCDRLINEAHRKQHNARCQKMPERRQLRNQRAYAGLHIPSPTISDELRVFMGLDMPLRERAIKADLLLQEIDMRVVDNLLSRDDFDETDMIDMGNGIIIIKTKA